MKLQPRRQVLAGALAFALVLPLLAACGKKAPSTKGTAVPAGATVLALGDSLTFGTGATPETASPTVLARLSGWNVVNAGIRGHTGYLTFATLYRKLPLKELKTLAGSS